MENRLNTIINDWFVKEYIRSTRTYIIQCTKCGVIKKTKFESLYHKTLKECPCHLKIIYKNPTQKQIYDKLKSGQTPAKIAKDLGMTRQGVSFHIKNMKKQCTKTDTESFISF